VDRASECHFPPTRRIVGYFGLLSMFFWGGQAESSGEKWCESHAGRQQWRVQDHECILELGTNSKRILGRPSLSSSSSSIAACQERFNWQLYIRKRRIIVLMNNFKPLRHYLHRNWHLDNLQLCIFTARQHVPQRTANKAVTLSHENKQCNYASSKGRMA
jgi:hypothetical protein